ncbi:MAG TPA: MerR family transcriptional regulator [Candidatus Hydromicrobium sp.]
MESGIVKKIYGSVEVCRIIGITYKQLDYYDRTGFIKPSVNRAGGYGSRRMYNFNDLMKLKVIKKLMEAGISLQKLRKTKRYLDEYENNKISSGDGLLRLTLISDGNTVYACNSDKAIVDTLKSGQGVFGIALGKVYSDLNGDIERYLMKNNKKGEIGIKLNKL